METKLRHGRWLVCGCGLLVMVVLGCGRAGSGRVPVTGSITFDGAPVTSGQIVLESTQGGGMSVGQIADGRYLIPEKYGPTGGEYLVRITSERASGAKVAPSSYAADQTPQDVYEQFLPAKYNAASELKLTIDGSSPVTHDFALTSK